MDATTIKTVSGIGRSKAAARVGLSTKETIAGQPPTGSPVEDTVELSPAGLALSRAHAQWFARICQIRSAIKAGTFETPERLHETASELLKVIGRASGT